MQYKIIVDKQPSSNPSNEKKEYVIDIEELRVKGNVYDSLNIEMNRTYVTRRLSLSEYGVLSVLEEPIIQELTEIDIKLFEGDNYIYLMDMQGNKFYAEYIIKNDFTDLYVTTNQMNSAITQSAESIELSVNQKLTSYATTDNLEEQVTELNSTINQTAQEINLEVSKKVGDDEIISKINQSAEEVQINANKISLDGKQINLTGDNISIESTNFNVDKDGNMTCNNANITGGNISLSGEEDIPKFTILSNSNNQIRTELSPTRQIMYYQGVGAIQMYAPTGIIGIVKYDDPSKKITLNPNISSFEDGVNTTTIQPSGITTPKLTQTSLESIKKNISKFDKNATDIINNSDIYEYNLKSDKDEDKKMIGFIIGEGYRTPDEVIDKDGQAVSLYSAIGILWKGFQEREEIIKQLKEENKRKDKILSELILRVEQLEKEVQHE